MIPSLLVLVIVVAAVLSFLMELRSRSDAWPVVANPVLTSREQPLFWRLQKALPDHVVLAQVQLSRMMVVRRTSKPQSWRNRIDRKSADFVVCRRDFSVAAVIELDDSTHDAPARRKADADKDAALSAAGIKVIRWRSIPDAQTIQNAVAEG